MDQEIADLSDRITRHLQRNSIYDGEGKTSWELRESPVGGRGLFATRDIAPGELILRDVALVKGPRAGENRDPICVTCTSKEGQKNLRPCAKGCGLPVCSQRCEDAPEHLLECQQIRCWKNNGEDGTTAHSEDLLRALAPVRSLFIGPQEKELLQCLAANEGKHRGFEVDLLKDKLNFRIDEADERYMRKVCAVFDTNGFECVVNCGGSGEDANSSIRGLYPLASLLNHNCVPNTLHVFDSLQRMHVQATLAIPKDGEIFASYTSFLWATPTRRHHLMKTKDFWCHCERCDDRLEFGAMLCGLSCVECDGVLLPVDNLNGGGKWRCEGCRKFVSQRTVGVVQSLLGSVVGSLIASDVPALLLFLRKRLPRLAPSFNQIVVELKCQAVWLLGHRNGFLWNGRY